MMASFMIPFQYSSFQIQIAVIFFDKIGILKWYMLSHVHCGINHGDVMWKKPSVHWEMK